MAEYIDKKELRFCEITEAVMGPYNFPILKHIKVDDIPTADVRENVHGHFNILNSYDSSAGFLISEVMCSRCNAVSFCRTTGNAFDGNKKPVGMNFCPNCGASMEGGG